MNGTLGLRYGDMPTEYNYRIFHLLSAKDRNILTTENTYVVDRATTRFSMPWRITTFFRLRYTHVRASYGVWRDRDHLRRYRRSRFKKGRWPAFVHVASFKTRLLSQSSAVSHFTIASATRAAECYISKTAGHTSLSSSPGNMFQCPYLDFILAVFKIIA